MNREIEFRGRSFSDGSWVYGDLEYERNKGLLGKVRIHTYKEDGSYDRQYLVEARTVGQYTGLKDNNGRKIYEGDVLCSTVFDCFGNDMQYTLEVEWLDSEFVASCNRNGEEKSWNLGWLHGQDDEIEVIGNIHDKQQEL